MKKFITALFVVCFATHVYGASTATLDKTESSLSDIVTLSITTDENTSFEPDLSVLRDNFNVVSTAVAQQSYIINGKAQSSRTWKIGLLPLKTGKITIPALNLGNQKTEPILLTVTDTPSNIAVPVSSSDTVQTAKPRYVLEAFLDNKEKDIYLQQQFNYIVTLTDDGSIEQGEPSFEPTDDFIITPLGMQTSQDPNGNRKTSFSYAFFAQKSGKIKIPKVNFSGLSYQHSNPAHIFGGGFFQIQMPSFFGMETPVHLAFDGPVVHILAAPKENNGSWWLPADNVTLEEKWIDAPKNLSIGTPFVRQITLEAEGLTAEQLPDINLDDVEGMKVYQEKPTAETKTSQMLVIGKQTVLVTYIPDSAGTLTLPEIKIKWFDLKDGQFKYAMIDKKTLYIKGNKEPYVAPKKTNSSGQKFHETKKMHPFIIALLAFIAGLFVAYFLFKPKNKKQANQNNNTPKIKITAHTDLKKLRDNVILSTAQSFPDREIKNLKDVSNMFLDVDLNTAIEELNSAMYDQNNKHTFDQKRFIKIFKQAIKNAKKQKVESFDPLPKLYK